MLGLLKFIGGPGSLGFLTASIVTLLVIARTRRTSKQNAHWAIAGLLVAYLILALPMVATAIASRLPHVQASNDLDEFRTIVVFDGDNRWGRLRTTEALLARGDGPDVVVLGGRWIFDHLAESGARRGRLSRQPETANTREQALWVRAYEQRGLGNAVVVASRLQVPRIASLFRTLGVRSTLVPAPVDVEPPTSGPASLIPTYFALRVTRDAVYEHVALVYYRWQGWI